MPSDDPFRRRRLDVFGGWAAGISYGSPLPPIPSLEETLGDAPAVDEQTAQERLLLAQLPDPPTRDHVIGVLAAYYQAHPEAIACARCGWPCQLAPEETDRPEVAILRGQSKPELGVCPSCNVTAFLQDPDLPFGGILAGYDASKREAILLSPTMIDMIRGLIAAHSGGMGLHPDLIRWERVHAFWGLPHPAGTYGRRPTRRTRRAP